MMNERWMRCLCCFLGWIVLVSSGCGPRSTYRVVMLEDQYDGSIDYQMQSNWAEPEHKAYDDLWLWRLGLNAERIDEGKTRHYHLRIVVDADRCLWTGPGKSLVLLVDGESLALTRRSRQCTEWVDCYGNRFDKEIALYDVGIDELRKISNATEVCFEVIGVTYTVDGHLVEDNFDHLRQFLTEYVVEAQAPR